ncbi:MAG TPA: methyltransferase domain-containing protein [Solirubrobacteraceae bacterium]|nr:methyltransferase domain-containing protein [Solirubrobacteraceae bacterium]
MSDDVRQQSRARWTATAQGWGARADQMRRATMPVATWMVDAIGPQPGDTLLELAAGPGDTGFLAAELIRPGGTLICSDFVPEMLNVAQERAKALSLDNVRFKQIDAETGIDIEAASIDGVLCRWGYMLMADPVTALAQTRRVLKPGARLALAAWTGPDENPWSALLTRELIRRGLEERPDPDAPGQFAWATEGVIGERLEEAGFVDYEVAKVGFALAFDSLEHWWDTSRDTSMRFADAAARMDAGTAAEVRAALAEAAAPYTDGDGAIAFPARTWTAVATA